jgi:hypothetical protein
MILREIWRDGSKPMLDNCALSTAQPHETRHIESVGATTEIATSHLGCGQVFEHAETRRAEHFTDFIGLQERPQRLSAVRTYSIGLLEQAKI